MRKRLALAVVMAAVAGAVPACAAGRAVPTVALAVDVQRILDESMAAKSVQKQLNTQRAQYQKETEKEENQLRQAEQDLGKAREQVSAAAYREREQQLRQRFLDVERRVDTRRKTLDQAFTASMNTVRETLIVTIQDIARARGANLVLVKQQVLWADQGIDITDEVLAKLNKTLPKVDVTLQTIGKTP